MPEFVTVARTREIAPDEGKLVEVNGQQVAIFNLNGQYYAIGNECTHMGGPLAEGYLDDGAVICPWHGGVFDIKTGKVLHRPPEEDVPTYQVKVEGSEIKIAVEE